MGLPTGNFSSHYAGRLRVTLTGKFAASAYTDAGFTSSGSTNLALRAFAGPSGSPSYSAVIDKFNQIAEFSLDYPGGDAVWPVGVEHVAHTFSGLSSSTFSEIRLTCELVKR